MISYPSPWKNNHGLKLLILYLVELERGCAKLEKSRMERPCNGLNGDAVQSSQWMDVGQNKSQGVGSEQGTALIIRRCVTVSNSLGQISDPRLIGSISSIIGQASIPQRASEEMPQVKKYNTSHHITQRYVHKRKCIQWDNPMSTSCKRRTTKTILKNRVIVSKSQKQNKTKQTKTKIVTGPVVTSLAIERSKSECHRAKVS